MSTWKRPVWVPVEERNAEQVVEVVEVEVNPEEVPVDVEELEELVVEAGTVAMVPLLQEEWYILGVDVEVDNGKKSRVHPIRVGSRRRTSENIG